MSAKWIMGVIAVLVGVTGLSLFQFFQAGAMQGINEAEILNATLQIEISVPVDGSGSKVANGVGLASLVWDGEKSLLVTHNHWGEILQEKAVVIFYDSHGNLVKTMAGTEFISQIRYLDAGTLILESPLEAMEQRLLVEDDPAKVDVGDVVLVAQREGAERMEVILLQAEVVSGAIIRGLPVYQIRSLEGRSVQRGDSGGGIWHDGKLVGNLWYTTMAEPTSFSLFSWVESENAELEATNESYAARFPVDQLTAFQGSLDGISRGEASEIP